MSLSALSWLQTCSGSTFLYRRLVVVSYELIKGTISPASQLFLLFGLWLLLFVVAFPVTGLEIKRLLRPFSFTLKPQTPSPLRLLFVCAVVCCSVHLITVYGQNSQGSHERRSSDSRLTTAGTYTHTHTHSRHKSITMQMLTGSLTQTQARVYGATRKHPLYSSLLIIKGRHSRWLT